MTYAANENVKEYLKQLPTSAPAKQSVEKFHDYLSPKLGQTRIHYGRVNDPKDYLNLTHGLHSDEKSFVILVLIRLLLCLKIVKKH